MNGFVDKDSTIQDFSTFNKPKLLWTNQARDNWLYLLDVTFEMILYITLHREMGLNFLGVSAPYEFGMRVKKVKLKSLKIP